MKAVLASRRLSIRWKLVLPFLLLGVTVGAVLIPVSSWLLLNQVQKEADRRLLEIAGSVAELIQDSEKEARVAADFVATLPETSFAINSLALAEESIPRRRDALELQEISLYGSSFIPGDPALYYGGPPVLRRSQTSPSTLEIRDQLITRALVERTGVSGIAIAPQSSQILGAAPVVAVSNSTGPVQAIVLAAVFMDEDYIEQISNLIGADVAIVSNNKIVVSTIDSESEYDEMIQTGFIDADTSYNSGTITYATGRQYRMLAAPLLLHGVQQGHVLIAQPVDQLYQLNQSIQGALIAAITLFAAFTLTIGIIAYLSFARPLVQLKEATSNVRQGEIDQHVSVSYFLLKDEITDLSENFNEMTSRLQALYDNLEDRVRERTRELESERNKLAEAMQALEAARDEAVTANRAKSEFVSLVSHELKVPMTSIKGYSELVLSGMVGEVNEQQRQFLKTIRHNVERMATLVSDLADISRIETGNLRLELNPVELPEVILETINSAKAQVEDKKQTLHLNLPDDLPEVWCDRNRLAQVLNNLVSNAVKYTPEGGNVTVQAAVTPDQWSGMRGDVVLVSVKDTGYGIKPEDQEKMFSKFFRSEDEDVRRAPGTGLGLNITRNLVELQNGKIWFESEYRQGTTFYFTLPVYRPE